MATSYCTAQQVASFLQVPTFTETTSPTKAEVDEMIEENEDLIDERTIHAWRERTETKESHSRDFYGSYDYYDGVDIHLKHRSIKDFSSGDGDKLEIWNGSEWEDYLTTRTEGRGNDFWIDQTKGILFIKTINRTFRTLSVRVTYRYGDATVDKEIRKACVRLTAIDLVEGDDRSILLPEGTSNIPPPQKVQKWQSQSDEILNANREWVVIGD